MILAAGTGLVATLAAAWALWERQRGAQAQARQEQVRLDLERALGTARAALETARTQLGVAQQGARAQLTSAEAAQARAVAAERARDEQTALVQRAEAVLARMRRALMDLKEDASTDRQRAQERETALAEEREAARARLAEAQAELGRRTRELEVALQERQRQTAALEAALEERRRLAREVEEARLSELELTTLREERAAQSARLEAAEATVTRLRQEAGRSPSREYFARMQELDQRVTTLQEELKRAQHRAQEAEAELSRREASPEDLAVVSERNALRERLEAQEEVLRRLARTRSALRVLGVPPAPRDGNLFAAERRNATEAVVRDTYLGAQAAGAALVDARGVAWARCGNLPVVERLGASAAILSRAPASPALGQPVSLVSESYGVYGRHLVALPGAGTFGLWLGVTASRECPALALRLGALQLVGSGGTLPPVPPAALAELDPASSDRLDAWALRRGALAVALFAEGPPAATDSAFAAACAPLVGVVRALHLRAARDGFSSGFQVIWRGEDDVSLAARVVEERDGVVFARFPTPPAARTLDDLVATVRWSADLGSPSP